MMQKTTSIWLSCAFIFLASSLFAQQELKPIHTKRNTLTVMTFLPRFFDGNPVFENYGAHYFLRKLGIGIQYERQLSPKIAVMLEASAMGTYYGFDDLGCIRNSGYVRHRTLRNISAAYVYHAFTSKTLQASILGGFMFRHGHEGLADKCDKYADNFSEYYALSDVGISAGLRGKVLLPLNLNFSTELRYTEFLYRSDKTRFADYHNFAGKGATRHLLTLQFGLGYQF